MIHLRSVCQHFQEYANERCQSVKLSSGDIIHHVDLEVAEWRVREQPNISAAINHNSDLIPHVYEGKL